MKIQIPLQAILLALLLGSGLLAQRPEPLVATHYFYWYRWPNEHFNPSVTPGREGHLHSLPHPKRVSYLDPKWHEAHISGTWPPPI